MLKREKLFGSRSHPWCPQRLHIYSVTKTPKVRAGYAARVGNFFQSKYQTSQATDQVKANPQNVLGYQMITQTVFATKQKLNLWFNCPKQISRPSRNFQISMHQCRKFSNSGGTSRKLEIKSGCSKRLKWHKQLSGANVWSGHWFSKHGLNRPFICVRFGLVNWNCSTTFPQIFLQIT